MLGHHIATMNGLALFCAGLALALIFGLGCMMAMTGGVLRRRKTRRFRAVRRDAAATARERDALAARLQEGETAAPAGSEPAATGDDAYGYPAGPGYAATAADTPDAPAATAAPDAYGATKAPGTDMADEEADRAGATTGGRPRHHHTRHLFGH
jgi:hypothetical protein